MHRGNLWGGPLEIWTGTNDKKKATTLRGGDLDPSAYSYKSSRAAAESDKNFLLEGWRMRGREDARRGKQVDLGFFVVSRRALFWTIGLVVGLAVVVVLLKIIISNFPLQPRVTPEDGYTVALRKALLFFDAQMSGVLPKNNSVSWRGNSGMKDGLCDNTVHNDLVGGFYDAGDAIKFNFPASFSITILSWSVIEYGNKYKAAGQLNHVMKIIKWGTDYILKTFNSSAGTIDKIVTQVGVGNTADKTPNDHYCWMRPEDMDYPRPVSICHACSDLAAEMASALAAAAIVFRDDGTYSKLLIDGAEKLWHFARNRRSTYSIDVDAMHFYNSTGYWDEFIWGGAWLYYATGNDSYLTMLANDLEFAKTAGNIWSNHDYRVFSWDSKLPGAQVLLTRLRVFVGPGYPFEEVLKTLHNLTDISMCSYLPIFSSSKRTKGGLILLNHGGSRPLQYVVNVAFLASLYSDYLEALSVPGWFCGPNFYSLDVLREFAKTQIDYILGRNPKNLSYVVGIGDRYPVHVHHRGASIPPDDIRYNCTEGWKWRDSKMPNPNLLVGAMVSGPDMNDKFQDVRTKQKYTEPTLAGNSGLVAALVSLSGDKSALDTNSMFSSVVQDKLPPPPPAPWHP